MNVADIFTIGTGADLVPAEVFAIDGDVITAVIGGGTIGIFVLVGNDNAGDIAGNRVGTLICGVIEEGAVRGVGTLGASGGFLAEELLLLDENDANGEAANEDENGSEAKDNFAAVFGSGSGWSGRGTGEFFGDEGGGRAGRCGCCGRGRGERASIGRGGISWIGSGG